MYTRAVRVGCFSGLVLAVLLLGCAPESRAKGDSSDAGSAGGDDRSSGGGTGGGGTSLADAGLGAGGARGASDDAAAPETDAAGGLGIDATDAGPANSLLPNQTMDCPTPPLAVPTQHLEAECALAPDGPRCAGVTAGQQGTQLQDAGTTVGYIEEGDTLWFSGLRMDGVTALVLRYAKGVDGGRVEIRLDGPSGTLLGSLAPTTTGSWTTWSTARVPLSACTGAHAVYLVASDSSAGILNLDWVELSGSAGTSAATFVVHGNHIGFAAKGGKHVVVEGDAGLDRYSIVGADGTAHWCGDLESMTFADWGSSSAFYSVDFTGLTRPGTYRLQIGAAVSDAFTIGDDLLFAQTFDSVLDYFKASRADDKDVWAADASVPLNGTDQRVDVRGGWYDASGDISKYLTHLSYANYMSPQQIPLVAWALAWVYDRRPGALGTNGRAATTQAEALWGADYLLRVLNPDGYFYTTVFDHWSGNVGAREICAFVGEFGGSTADWQSALREGGGMSIAALARIARWHVDGSFTSAEYLAGAARAFDYLNVNGVQHADDGKENIIDDYTGLLAASELYATTQDAAYLAAARARVKELVGRLSADGYFIADGASRPFWHASDAGLPVVALARYVEIEPDGKNADGARAAIAKHLAYLLRITAEPANPFGYARQHTRPDRVTFFMPHINETEYWWQGENARLGSLSAAALLGAEATGARGESYLQLLRFAGSQVDWILGSNPYDVCFLHGFGRNNPPPYCASKAQAGTLVGGIANGITGSEDDGTGIRWPTASNASCGDDWRTVEQWLPHAAWYLVAITALTE